MDTKIQILIDKLNAKLSDDKIIPNLPYLVDIDKINEEIISKISDSQAKINKFSELINQIVQKVNNSNIYTNDKPQSSIQLEDMDKLRDLYQELLNELLKFRTEEKVQTPLGGNVRYNYYNIKPITNVYAKYYLAYLLSNIISLLQFFKIFSETLKLTEIDNENITNMLDELSSKKRLVIYFNNIGNGNDIVRDCISFNKTSDNPNQLENNGFIITIKFESKSDGTKAKKGVSCKKDSKQLIIFNETLDYNFKLIKFIFKIDNLELINNFVFNINYYECKQIGTTTPYALQFVLSNNESKLKFFNKYKGFDSFI